MQKPPKKIPRPLKKNQLYSSQNGSFRSLNYLGSKLRILDFLKKVADKEDPTQGALCDLFAGSGTVSHYFSRSRRIISIDIQEYSKIICDALLKPCLDPNILKHEEKSRLSVIRPTIEKAMRPLISYEKKVMELGKNGDLEPVCNFLENCSLYGSIESIPYNCFPELRHALLRSIESLRKQNFRYSLTSIYFGGVYFSFEQSASIDAILYEINHAPADHRSTLMAALLGTASDIVNSVGKQFAQPIRPRKKNGEPKPNLIKQLSKDRDLDVFKIFQSWLVKYTSQEQPSKFGHEIHCVDFRNALDSLSDDVTIVYADPPYTRDHYSRFYHGLETLCLQDYPEISKTNIGGSLRLSRGLYRLDRHQSPFCIKSQAPMAFNTLFEKVANKGKILMLSYSPYDKKAKAHPRVMELQKLELLAKKYFNHVKSYSPGTFTHSKLNHTDKHLTASRHSELVIVCRN